jgi:hypothetical protein
MVLVIVFLPQVFYNETKREVINKVEKTNGLITDLSKIYYVPEVDPLAARYVCVDTGGPTEKEAILVGVSTLHIRRL